MANGLFSSNTKKKANEALNFSLEEQIEQIRSDISSLAKVLSDRGAETSKEVKARARDARDTAEAGFSDLLANSEDLIADLRSRYASTEKQIRDNVREHPLATIGIAAAAGILLAALLRR
ncbi:glycine zipper domain-containing protein [Pararhizobium sp.]|uniref:glycine zipper domain-containing protein n=1 Tax=Pararhizobium sp. TaxID=1977563 RepID=UPI0027162C2E|nr:hypothetical protein [Pararhizobium sp.]MDO9414972.1 hypothetical protein [Pararhizobium sp.]